MGKYVDRGIRGPSVRCMRKSGDCHSERELESTRLKSCLELHDLAQMRGTDVERTACHGRLLASVFDAFRDPEHAFRRLWRNKSASKVRALVPSHRPAPLRGEASADFIRGAGCARPRFPHRGPHVIWEH